MVIPIRCTCGKAYAVKDSLAGKRVRCPACQAPIAVPPPTAGAAKAQRFAGGAAPGCPNCRADMAAGQVVCMKCGHNAQTKARVRTRVGSDASPPRPSVAPPGHATLGRRFVPSEMEEHPRLNSLLVRVPATMIGLTFIGCLWPVVVPLLYGTFLCDVYEWIIKTVTLLGLPVAVASFTAAIVARRKKVLAGRSVAAMILSPILLVLWGFVTVAVVAALSAPDPRPSPALKQSVESQLNQRLGSAGLKVVALQVANRERESYRITAFVESASGGGGGEGAYTGKVTIKDPEHPENAVFDLRSDTGQPLPPPN